MTGRSEPAWSDWQPLPLAGNLTPRVLAEIVDGGQAFRWQRQPDESWLGIFGDHLVRLSLDDSGTLRWAAPALSAEGTAVALAAYLDLERSAKSLADKLPWRSDPHLAKCIDAFPGLRILRQPFGETLLGFLCSATKQIVQIKQMLALLAERHGASLSPAAGARVAQRDTPVGGALVAPRGAPVGCALVAQRGSTSAPPTQPGAPGATPTRRLPTWAELAVIPESELRACLLGFRARYIHHTAQFLAANPGWLEETETLPYAAAKERLCSLPGVGEKVADCVLLFGARRLEAFPVDVWIIKAMAERYGLHGWKPAQIAHFGRVHFGPLAGLAQQYLFAFEREERRASRASRFGSEQAGV